MADKINAAGYELKPWWPYVRELMSNQVTVESVTILENGVYTAPAGKAYSPVTVNVPTYEVDSLSVTENGTYTAEAGKAYSPVVVNVPAAGVTASVTFVADEGITLFGVTSMAYLVDGTQTYTAEDRTQFTASVPTTVPILDSIVLYELVCMQDQSTPLQNVAFDLAGDAEFNQDHEIVITGDCVITVKDAQ